MKNKVTTICTAIIAIVGFILAGMHIDTLIVKGFNASTLIGIFLSLFVGFSAGADVYNYARYINFYENEEDEDDN